ncbi:hypothetical protein P280DRAFT_504832 [Massarina eburnea CBS 473.64]|uniref:Uncharacterized protein n=1 Tax=Massarina eburnea CBS 473.64 TaxID=1395130 RepID=A0A6A6SAP7_9PLEO|nr:hypothetical protein P280DRAFT_504832 [Massarina eburnea CBS 473.64]
MAGRVWKYGGSGVTGGDWSMVYCRVYTKSQVYTTVRDTRRHMTQGPQNLGTPRVSLPNNLHIHAHVNNNNNNKENNCRALLHKPMRPTRDRQAAGPCIEIVRYGVVREIFNTAWIHASSICWGVAESESSDNKASAGGMRKHPILVTGDGAGSWDSQKSWGRVPGLGYRRIAQRREMMHFNDGRVPAESVEEGIVDRRKPRMTSEAPELHQGGKRLLAGSSAKLTLAAVIMQASFEVFPYEVCWRQAGASAPRPSSNVTWN